MEWSLDPKHRVLVTGATGFLGGWVVQRLLDLNIPVTAIGRNENIGKSLSEKGARFQKCDLENLEQLSEIISGHSHILHSGALSSVWGTYEQFFKANVLGTRNVLIAATKNNCKRVVHISTPTVYVEPKSKINIPEDTPLPKTPINHYAATKRLAEIEVDEAVKRGLSVITLRPQGIFGPGDQAILPRIVGVAKKGFFPVIGNEDVLTDLTPVQAVVDAIISALNAPNTLSGRKYNITGGHPIRNQETIDFILKELQIPFRHKKLSLKFAWNLAAFLEWSHRNFLKNQEPLITRYSVCALAFSRTLNIDRARNELNFNPQYDILESLKEAIKWYQTSNF